MPRAKQPKPEFVFALQDQLLRIPGDKYSTFIRGGDAYYADCPVVKAHPKSFASEPTVIYPLGWVSPARVEQATAAPGEQRDSGRA